MRSTTSLALLVGWLLMISPAHAIDYEKIDRTILKEPKYKSDSPRYALLLFGPEAKLKVWMAFDGDDIYYIDRNMDGDLTGADERFDDPVKDEWLGDNVKIDDPDGKTSYFIQSVGTYKRDRLPGGFADVMVKISGPVNYREYCNADMWDDPKKAAIAHFHGPLTAGPVTNNWKVSSNARLVASNESFRLDAQIGTFNAKQQCWVVVSNSTERDGEQYAFPGRHPTVSIEYSRADAARQTVKQLQELNEFCCGSLFYAKFKVPPEAGLGKAKVTFAFDAWAEGKVKPTTVELPVVTVEQAKATDAAATAK